MVTKVGTGLVTMRRSLCGLLVVLGVVALYAGVFPLILPGTNYSLEQRNVVVLTAALVAVWWLDTVWGEVRQGREARRLAAEIGTLKRTCEEHEALLRERQKEVIALSEEGRVREQRVEVAAREAAEREARLAEEITELRRALRQAEARAEQHQQQQQLGGREFMHLLARLQEKGRFIDFRPFGVPCGCPRVP